MTCSGTTMRGSPWFCRERGIDLLIDLGGYGDFGRMPVCAHRAAPVQIKWVGMQNGSTGLAEMDWMIADRWEMPEAFERFYSERLLRLPTAMSATARRPMRPTLRRCPRWRTAMSPSAASTTWPSSRRR